MYSSILKQIVELFFRAGLWNSQMYKTNMRILLVPDNIPFGLLPLPPILIHSYHLTRQNESYFHVLYCESVTALDIVSHLEDIVEVYNMYIVCSISG